MKGKATFLSERFEKVLEEGTLVIIPKETYHKFQIESPNEYTRLVFNFPDIAEIKDIMDEVLCDIKIIENISTNIRYLVNRSIEILNGEEENRKKPLLYASLYMLLAELNVGGVDAFTPVMRESDQLISKCIRYIDQHFAKDISVEKLALEMRTSVSTLRSCFKRYLGISVYKYITEKRLIHAHRQIVNGASPTKIYNDCGYRDYPTFYKAYVKMFGHAPYKDKQSEEIEAE